MEISRTRIALRPRHAWEAADLGLIMLRLGWRAIYAPVAAVVVFVAVIVFVAVSQLKLSADAHVYIAVGALWWMKPLYDRLVLSVLSEAVFGETPPVLRTLFLLPRLFGAGLWWQLTLGRLDLARSFRLPIWQLEGLERRGRRRRFQVLDAGTRGHAAGITVLFLGLELVLLLSLFALLYLFSAESSFDLHKHGQSLVRPLSLVLGAYVLVVIFLEPIYVGSGFGLYLNRRMVLEGWDIELDFRRLTARHETFPKGLGGTLGCLCILALASTVVMTPAMATLKPIGGQLDVDANAAARYVLARPPLLATKETKPWQLRSVVRQWLEKFLPNKGGDAREISNDWLRFLTLMASAFKGVLWIGVVAFVGWITWYALRWSSAKKWERPGVRETPLATEYFERDQVSLLSPRVSVAEARRLVDSGDSRGALALLYRASVAYIEAQGVQVAPGATEEHVFVSFQVTAPVGMIEYFGYFLEMWQGLAYAERDPGRKETLELCDAWAHWFHESKLSR